MIEIKDLSKRYGKNPVLSSLELELASGRIYAILGPNGSGKTTLIKCLLGMVIPDRGDIRIDGEPVRCRWRYRNHINYLPQIANFPGNLTVRELIRMIEDLRQSEADSEALVNRFKLEPHLNKKLNALSGGTRQKVNLVLAFMFDSPLLILDEPSTGLDPAALIRLKEMIRDEKERGKTILITTHIMQIVEELADEVVYLLEGEIRFKGSVQLLKEETRQRTVEHAIAVIANAEPHA